jgi:uncharacterized protein
VIANALYHEDGRPMPTRYWLVDPELCRAVARLESAGGIREAEAEVPPDAVQRAHDRYRVERARAARSEEPGARGTGAPAPQGGVGGTRRGVKCLHAHLAWWLVGGDDPVGAWTAGRLGLVRPVRSGGALRPLSRASKLQQTTPPSAARYAGE